MKHLILCIILSLLAHKGYAQTESAKKKNAVMRATLYGAGTVNILDTYLTPAEYKGTEFRVLRESMRMTKLLDGKVSTQSVLQINFSSTKNQSKTGRQLTSMLNWNYAWHYQFQLTEQLKLLAGPMIDLNGGVVYNLRNSNNPAQAKGYLNIAASGMAIYRFNLGKIPLIARYQLNLPLVGAYFSPEYGQTYYEIFILKHGGKNVLFTSLHNQPSMRQMLTLDFPVSKVNLRLGYICDLQQANVNNLKSHIWSNIFMVGFVRSFSLFKGKEVLTTPAHTNPY